MTPASDQSRSPDLLPNFATRATPASGLFVLILCDLILLIIYVWFVSVRTWTHWPTLSTFYDQLATGFGHGHTWLDTPPDPAILALSDPYDPAQRTGLPYTMDWSLYNGHYYLYFGPAPALLLLIVKLFVPGVIGDEYPAFAFIYGIAAIQSLLLLKIYKRFYPDLSLGLLAIGILVSGLAGPYTWLLSTPDAYITAILCGQFFFLLGLYTVIDAAGGSLPSWKLALTGTFWAIAIASRITQAIPIAVLLIFLSVRFLFKPGHGRPQFTAIRGLLPLAIPLALGTAALGWYNWIRFGSVLETGFKYALTGESPLYASLSSVFSLSYVIQNLYNYLLRAPALRPTFPFIEPRLGLFKSVIASIQLPALYATQYMTGLLFGAPFVLFALVPARQLLRKSVPDARSSDRSERPLLWVTAALFGCFLSAFIILLVYFWTAERYFADYLPALMLLSAIGFWQLNRALPRPSFWRLLYVLVAVGLIASSVIVSTLTAFA